jgi:hypothetical protein
MPLYPKGRKKAPRVLPEVEHDTPDGSALLAASEDRVLAWTALDVIEKPLTLRLALVAPIQVQARGNQQSVQGDLFVIGVDAYGGVCAERLSLAGTVPIIGAKRFQVISAVTLPRKSPAGGDEQIVIGNAPPLLP